MCWVNGEDIQVSSKYVDAGVLDDFISRRDIFCSEPIRRVTDNSMLARAQIIPGLGFRAEKTAERTSYDVIVTLKGNGAHIREFKKHFVRSH